MFKWFEGLGVLFDAILHLNIVFCRRLVEKCSYIVDG